MSKTHICTEPDCQAKFSRPYRLETHLRKHKGERPFACDEENCGKTYTNQSHLRRHKKTAHSKASVKLQRCSVKGCYKVVSNRTNLLRHIKRIHEAQKDHACEECNAQFHKKHQLRSHMYEHTAVAPYSCEHCPRAFVNMSDYKKHHRSHKSYTCKCGEIFYRWTIFRKHKSENCGTKVYACNTCDKTFERKSNYHRHLLSHEESREVFECPYESCHRLYYYKKNLTQHIKVFHLKVKMKERIRKKPPTKVKKTVRATRKDKGTIKKSSALYLTRLAVPYAAEKTVLTGGQIEAENISDFIESSDVSDVELRINIITGIQQPSVTVNQMTESREDSVST